VGSAAQFIAEGHFADGSMRPKVEAATQFVRDGGKRAVITSIEAIESAVKGEAGTEITL
jgi:carbamate kinase